MSHLPESKDGERVYQAFARKVTRGAFRAPVLFERLQHALAAAGHPILLIKWEDLKLLEGDAAQAALDMLENENGFTLGAAVRLIKNEQKKNGTNS